jgi:rhodanese-related sulfurtransferase
MGVAILPGVLAIINSTVNGELGPVIAVEELLSSARASLARLTPAQALREAKKGTVLIDIRPVEQRNRDGLLPGARVIPRNVLEWRLDPQCEHRSRELARVGRRVIVVCDEGFQSSLAAATLQRFGLDATDMIGGMQAWLGQQLPVERPVDRD